MKRKQFVEFTNSNYKSKNWILLVLSVPDFKRKGHVSDSSLRGKGLEAPFNARSYIFG
jgi:hypothetical protein